MMTEMTMVMLVGLMIPLLGTMLGSAFVFFMKEEMSVQLQKLLLGFASGVMVAASVWSLLIPAMEMESKGGFWSVVLAAVGFLIGIGFLLLIDELTPHLHFDTDKPEGMRSHLSKTAMLALAVTIHNLPEGMAVGVVFAGAGDSAAHISLASAISLSLGIAIQNIPEGAIISMPMRAAGNSRRKSFFAGYTQWCRRAFGSHSGNFACLASNSCSPLYACFCSGSHVLRRRRRVDTRSLQRSA